MFGDAVNPCARDRPDFFRDLNLDQVLAALTIEREEYELEPFFAAALHDVDAVRCRQEILRDLEKSDVAAAVSVFAESMRSVRACLANAAGRGYRYEKERWVVDAAAGYCAAVRDLASRLRDVAPSSRGLRLLTAYLETYTDSAAFVEVEADAAAVLAGLSEVAYTVRINGPRVRVSNYEGETDYSVEVEETFARFKQGAVRNYLLDLREVSGMNHVEARIVDLVARLNPSAFAALDRFAEKHARFADPRILRFDREVQFYLGYLALIAPLRRAGLPFCYPAVSARSKRESVSESFDLALALKLVGERAKVVCNDFSLDDAERILVVTGPNNGGKTTFARMFGQLHHLAALGLLVPGSRARLFLPDRIFTHFEREEEIEKLRGKLDDELVRVRSILEQATDHSVVVMNESFGSTTLNDALLIGTTVMERLVERDLLGVYVTFVDELASLSNATVSMVSTVVPDNPALRTYKLVRQRADGLAYAWAIAEKYGLTYERLRERLAS